MINFIVCDDELNVLKDVEKIIDKYMMQNKLAYKVHTFSDFTDDFMKIISKNLSNKIYILDIQTPSRSGVDIARTIRINDIDSVIIFLTCHEELGLTILKRELMFLSFINKYDDYEKRLEDSIKRSLDMLKMHNVVRFEDHGIVYSIVVNDILYVTWDSIERKSIVKSLHSEIKINKSLIELNKLLGDKFIRVHKACIVNTERVMAVDRKKRIITFNNGVKTDLLSNKYKKELLSRIYKGYGKEADIIEDIEKEVV